MSKKICLFFVIFLLFLLINPVFAFSFKKKKIEPPKEKMPETVEQWELEAQNIPLNLRELEGYTPNKSDKKFYYPTPHFVFEKYNSPAGSREANIENIKKDLNLIPYIVTDSKFQYVAYPRYYFDAENNQISSAFFIEKLDTSKTRKNRLLNYIHNQQERMPVIESGTKKIYKNLFNGLALVDWSKDSKKVLVKEKTGSLLNGIYKTYLYVCFIDDEGKISAVKLDNFDRAIKNYFIDINNILLVNFRYDIYPLGFSAKDDNVIVAYCYVLDKNNKKIFLGIWGYNVLTNETILISKDMKKIDISANGIFLKQVLN